MTELYNEIISKVKDNYSNEDIVRIEKAYNLATLAHKDQTRESGEPYISHPLNVAKILTDFDPDANTIITAILHDIIEDTDITYKDIKKQFGEDVADLVEGVTKLGKIEYSSKEEQQIENLRKMILAMAKDIRVILVKLADRLHNMRTISAKVEKKRLSTSLETMEVYAPLAHRLGIQKIKLELEDLSLYQLDRIGYEEINALIKVNLQEKKEIFNAIIEKIKARIEKEEIDFVLENRLKHIYSIYRKMFKQNKEFEEVYDFFALRIIVNNITECYTVLGVIHDEFHPIPGRFKDYISTPKPNMYQSLHTTVVARDGVAFEVQIRTVEMHRTAEYGIAAHWKYKSGVFGNKDDEKFNWVRQLLELQNEATEPEEFMRALKIDMFADEVFVFTPNGDVINLPNGATPIDFAYTIHSGVGNRMNGAKVNGKIVELSYILKNGDRCEALTSAGHTPNREWLKIAKTSEARNKIRQWFKKECREENIETGRRDLENELKRNGIRFSDAEKQDVLEPVYKRLGMNSIEDFYAAIGYGGVFISKIMPKLKDEYNKRRTVIENQEPTFVEQKNVLKNSNGITVEGIDNCLVKFSQCCTPVPGDDVIGFITRGFGVSIHKTDCKNVNKLIANEPERIVNVHWNIERNNQFVSTINIIALDRIGLAADITSVLASMRVMIRNLGARELKNDTAIVSVNIVVKDTEHLNSVIEKLKNIKDIYSVKRGTTL